MKRYGDTIIFELPDSRRADDQLSKVEIDASDAPAVYGKVLKHQAALAIGLFALKQKGAGMAEQTMAQENANTKSDQMDHFLSELGELAPDEIAKAMIDEIEEDVLGPAA